MDRQTMVHGVGLGPQFDLLLRVLSPKLSHSNWACCHLALHTKRGVCVGVCLIVCLCACTKSANLFSSRTLETEAHACHPLYAFLSPSFSLHHRKGQIKLMSLEVNRKPKADFDYIFSFSLRFFHRFSLLNCASLSGDGFKTGTKEISSLTNLDLCSFLLQQ